MNDELVRTEALFRAWDKNADGSLDYEEILTGCLGSGMHPDDVSELFARLDVNADGRVTLEEWLSSAARGVDASIQRLETAPSFHPQAPSDGSKPIRRRRRSSNDGSPPKQQQQQQHGGVPSPGGGHRIAARHRVVSSESADPASWARGEDADGHGGTSTPEGSPDVSGGVRSIIQRTRANEKEEEDVEDDENEEENIFEYATPGSIERLYEIGHVLGKGAFSTVRAARRIRGVDRPWVAVKDLRWVSPEEYDPIAAMRARRKEEAAAVAAAAAGPPPPAATTFSRIGLASERKKRSVKQRMTRDMALTECAIWRRVCKKKKTIEGDEIVRFHECFVESNRVRVVSELMSGGSVWDILLQDGTAAVSPESALRITFRLLAALARCHEVGVIHRDVKLDNLLLPNEGSSAATDAKLADFGKGFEVNNII